MGVRGYRNCVEGFFTTLRGSPVNLVDSPSQRWTQACGLRTGDSL